PWMPPVETVVWENPGNNKTKKSDEDRPVYPNSSNFALNHRQRDGENALNRRARMILGCRHVFHQNRGRRVRSILLWAKTVHAQKTDCRTFVRQRFRLLSRESYGSRN